MKSSLYLIGSSLCGAALYLSQQGGLLFVVGLIAVGGMCFIVENTMQKWLRFACVNLFFLAYIVPTFWCLSYAAPEGSPIGLLLVVIPYTIYVAPMVWMLFVKRHIVEIFLVSWLLSEWFFTWIEIGNPFLQVGTVFSYYPGFIQWYPYTGPLAGSLWLLASTYVLYRLVVARNIHYGWSVVVLLPIVCSFVLGYADNDKPKQRTIGIVALDSENTRIDSILLSHNKETRIDYIFCPEAVWNFLESSFETHPRMTSIRRSLIDSLQDATLIMGVFMFSPEAGLQNAISTYSRNNTSMIRYKQRYIPFGEYVPYPRILGDISFLREFLAYDLVMRENESELFFIHGDTIAPLICYEGVFTQELSKLCRSGAEIVFISASNEMINSGHIEKIIRNLSVANAITLNRSIVRATSNGLSYAVDPHGRILTYSSQENTFLTSNVPLETRKTFYCRYGTLLNTMYGIGYLLLWMILILLAVRPTTAPDQRSAPATLS